MWLYCGWAWYCLVRGYGRWLLIPESCCPRNGHVLPTGYVGSGYTAYSWEKTWYGVEAICIGGVRARNVSCCIKVLLFCGGICFDLQWFVPAFPTVQTSHRSRYVAQGPIHSFPASLIVQPQCSAMEEPNQIPPHDQGVQMLPGKSPEPSYWSIVPGTNM